MRVLIQTAAEVLTVSAIPLVIASVISIAFELVLIEQCGRSRRSSAYPNMQRTSATASLRGGGDNFDAPVLTETLA
jgi:hypothetical protein